MHAARTCILIPVCVPHYPVHAHTHMHTHKHTHTYAHAAHPQAFIVSTVYNRKHRQQATQAKDLKVWP